MSARDCGTKNKEGERVTQCHRRKSHMFTQLWRVQLLILCLVVVIPLVKGQGIAYIDHHGVGGTVDRERFLVR